jgi:hypothetical protein
MKYGVNRVALAGNVGEVPRVSEREGEVFLLSVHKIRNVSNSRIS